MLRSYSAQINGAEIVWLDQVPVVPRGALVLVVVEDVVAVPESKVPRVTQFADLAGRLQWKGDAVKAQRGQRDAW